MSKRGGGWARISSSAGIPGVGLVLTSAAAGAERHRDQYQAREGHVRGHLPSARLSLVKRLDIHRATEC